MESPDASTLAAAILARFAAAIDAAGRPFLLGVSGLQGSGKSTLASCLVDMARRGGRDAVTLSLDDVYLTRAERAALAAAAHPLLRTRGVPGTHDLGLLSATLDALACASPAHPVALPRFDKGRDDRSPSARWPRVERAPALIIVEGWCVGVEPERDPAALREPLNALERDEDADGRWRRWVDARLADYVPLWRRLDALVVLQAPSWEVVASWRAEAEAPLRARGEPHAMDEPSLARFLQHYERLSRRALATLGAKADWVVTLDRARRAIPGA